MNEITDNELAHAAQAPRGTGAMISVRLSPDQALWLGQQAAATGATVSDVLRSLIDAARRPAGDLVTVDPDELHRALDRALGRKPAA
ncbi:MAG: hypothetical protein ACRDT4_03375 [Micromonosporaceae bacterium]